MWAIKVPTTSRDRLPKVIFICFSARNLNFYEFLKMQTTEKCHHLIEDCKRYTVGQLSWRRKRLYEMCGKNSLPLLFDID